jgi:hypothetical protein
MNNDLTIEDVWLLARLVRAEIERCDQGTRQHRNALRVAHKLERMSEGLRRRPSQTDPPPGAPATAHTARSDADDIPIDWIRWRSVGQLSRDELGDLAFPPVSSEPGIYRFLVRDDTGVVAGYIGQAAKSLAKRFSLYRTRGRWPSYPLEKKTTSRNALRLIAELRAGHTVSVDLVDNVVGCPDRRDLMLDLANAEFRSILERRLILQLCETGIEVLNRIGNPRWQREL